MATLLFKLDMMFIYIFPVPISHTVRQPTSPWNRVNAPAFMARHGDTSPKNTLGNSTLPDCPAIAASCTELFFLQAVYLYSACELFLQKQVLELWELFLFFWGDFDPIIFLPGSFGVQLVSPP